VDGEVTTISYDTLSQLPILFTKPGITKFTNYIKAFQAYPATQHIPTMVNNNMRKPQHHQLYLHEISAHEDFWNLNKWIREGIFPGVDPKLTSEPDPKCAACALGKAHRICHKRHTGQISSQLTKPGQGVSLDGLESSTPCRPHKRLSFWH
jgi:hypothetical protein